MALDDNTLIAQGLDEITIPATVLGRSTIKRDALGEYREQRPRQLIVILCTAVLF